jgi:hypothetical protein
MVILVAVNPAMLRNCIVSTDELDTITMAEFCFNPSLKIIIAL